jgi:hypothetical protein
MATTLVKPVEQSAAEVDKLVELCGVRRFPRTHPNFDFFYAFHHHRLDPWL